MNDNEIDCCLEVQVECSACPSQQSKDDFSSKKKKLACDCFAFLLDVHNCFSCTYRTRCECHCEKLLSQTHCSSLYVQSKPHIPKDINVNKVVAPDTATVIVSNRSTSPLIFWFQLFAVRSEIKNTLSAVTEVELIVQYLAFLTLCIEDMYVRNHISNTIQLSAVGLIVKKGAQHMCMWKICYIIINKGLCNSKHII